MSRMPRMSRMSLTSSLSRMFRMSLTSPMSRMFDFVYVIRYVSSCLRACLRAGCTVCRIALLGRLKKVAGYCIVLLGRLKKVAGVLYCIVRASEKGRRCTVLLGRLKKVAGVLYC